ncbi:MAG TPA: Cof-type HAD-IIB family hydrolase [Fimbriimonadaceae bacterium]|nr:Cof-type HAD-IIB family hydrolase [Fimbriimonadaceae bacterium]
MAGEPSNFTVAMSMKSSSKIRMIALDLDGTLLTDERRPHPRVKDAIRVALQAGLHVVLASGRSPKTLRPIQQELELEGPVVACNGSYVLSQEGECLFDRRVSDRVRETVSAYARQEQVQFFLYLQDQVLVFEELEWLAEYVRRVKIDEFRHEPWDRLGEFQPTKVLLMDQPDRIQAHRSFLEPELGPEECEVTVSEPVYLEFLPAGVTKAAGLQALADHCGLASDEVAAIGDYHNDLEMLRWCGYSGAVDNAHPEILSAVNRVFPSNNHGGVADFIFSIVYNQET